MYPDEPVSVALFLTVFALLIGASVILSHASEWTGVPVVLIFLALGMLAGRQGLGHLAFQNYRLSFDLGTVALVLILFDGGLNTPLAIMRGRIWPAVTLATVGVLGTAALVSVGARLFGFSWTQALLLGAIVSPTDASAVFSILRGSGVHLKKRVGVTLELESGLNDPMAVILTFALTQSLMERHGIEPGEPARNSDRARGRGGAWNRDRIHRAIHAPADEATGRRALSGAYHRAGVHRVWAAGATGRQRLFGGLHRGGGDRQRSDAVSRRKHPGSRRAGVVLPAHDVPAPWVAGSAVASAESSGSRNRNRTVSCVDCAADNRAAVPAAVSLSDARDGVRGMGGAARRGPDNPGNLPRCWPTPTGRIGSSMWCSSSWW
jgi:hypothetical protein